MSNIRVTYSGLISFATGIGSIITGGIFTLILTRTLTIEEFGTWELIGSIIGYSLLIESPIFFWITREVARKGQSPKTAIITSGMFSTIGILVYVIATYFIGEQSNADVLLMMAAASLIPIYFLNHTLTGINQGWKPQVISFGFIITEISKVPLGLILIYFLDLGILGVIITMAIATLGSVIIQSVYARTILKGKFHLKYLKKWLKLAWVALYRDIPGTLFISDVVIFSVITGSVVGVAYLTVAKTVANIVRHTDKISIAIYPKMLEGGKREHLQENFSRVLFFAIPTVSLSIVFARPSLFAMNPQYEIAALIVVFLTFRSFLSTINRIFRGALLGIEKVDISEKSNFKDYLKSYLITLPTIRSIQYASYAILLIIGLYILVQIDTSQIELVTYWSVIAVIVEIPFVIYFGILIRRNFKFQLDFKSIFKYILVSIFAFGVTHVLMTEFLIYEVSIFNFLPNLLLFALFGISFYLSITFVIDTRTRTLVKGIINEFQNIIRKKEKK